MSLSRLHMKAPKITVSGEIHQMTAGNLDARTGLPPAAPTMPFVALSAGCRRLQGVAPAGLCPDPNQEWQRQRGRATLDAIRGAMTGLFQDIDPRGGLPLRISAGSLFALPAHRVKLLCKNF